MESTIKQLIEASKKCYGNPTVKSSAILFSKDNCSYIGMSMEILGHTTTAISSAICFAISDGKREFSQMIVYVDAEVFEFHDVCDSLSISMLKEFRIGNVQIISSNGKIYSLNT